LVTLPAATTEWRITTSVSKPDIKVQIRPEVITVRSNAKSRISGWIMAPKLW
jgi:hypothetical protein